MSERNPDGSEMIVSGCEMAELAYLSNCKCLDPTTNTISDIALLLSGKLLNPDTVKICRDNLTILSKPIAMLCDNL